MVGIVSYGFYLPKSRIKTGEIAAVWGKEADLTEKSLGVSEKTVASYDEDTVTLGFEASNQVITKAGIKPSKIGAVFVGSESHPYAVNPSATIIADFLGVGNNFFASDLEFACKAATTGMIISSSLLQSGKIDYALSVGADCAQAKPHDILEYTAASGAVAVLLGRKKEEVIAEMVDYTSFSSDTPDFWRRDGAFYPSHGGRFTGEPSYFTHILGASLSLLEKTKMKPSDFAYCVFHMPNGRFPRQVGKRLGFSSTQYKLPLLVEQIGNPYSASSLFGLADVLETARENQYILFCSYGSGAGADAFILKTTKNLKKFQKKKPLLKDALKTKRYISYVSYLRLRGAI